MQKITISQKEYRELLEAKLRYKYLREAIDEDIFSVPPIKNARDIKKAIKEFENMGLYNKKFINGLEKGLKRFINFKKP